jgi:hypothetical protein
VLQSGGNPMSERRREAAAQRASSYLEVARACFRDAEVACHWRTAVVFRKLGQQYLDKAKRLNPTILASPPARTRLTWRDDSSAVHV